MKLLSNAILDIHPKYALLICLFLAFFTESHARQDTVTRKPIHHQIGFDIRPGYILPTKSFSERERARETDTQCHFRPSEMGFPIPRRFLFRQTLPARLSRHRRSVHFFFQCFRNRKSGKCLRIPGVADSATCSPAQFRLRMEFRRGVRLEEI